MIAFLLIFTQNHIHTYVYTQRGSDIVLVRLYDYAKFKKEQTNIDYRVKFRTKPTCTSAIIVDSNDRCLTISCLCSWGYLLYAHIHKHAISPKSHSRVYQSVIKKLCATLVFERNFSLVDCSSKYKASAMDVCM